MHALLWGMHLAPWRFLLASCGCGRADPLFNESTDHHRESAPTGEVLVSDGKLRTKPGSGQFLARKAGQAAEPLGRLAPEFDPKRNFGARM